MLLFPVLNYYNYLIIIIRKKLNFFCPLFSIEDDFITWKDKFWPAVCEHFGIEALEEDVSVRQYRLTEHDDVALDRIFTGEVARIQSLKNQRP